MTRPSLRRPFATAGILLALGLSLALGACGKNANQTTTTGAGPSAGQTSTTGSTGGQTGSTGTGQGSTTGSGNGQTGSTASAVQDLQNFDASLNDSYNSANSDQSAATVDQSSMDSEVQP